MVSDTALYATIVYGMSMLCFIFCASITSVFSPQNNPKTRVTVDLAKLYKVALAGNLQSKFAVVATCQKPMQRPALAAANVSFSCGLSNSDSVGPLPEHAICFQPLGMAFETVLKSQF